MNLLAHMWRKRNHGGTPDLRVEEFLRGQIHMSTRSQRFMGVICLTPTSNLVRNARSTVTGPDSVLGSQLDDGLVSCPLCYRRMKEAQVFSHLDLCGKQDVGSLSRPQPTILGYDEAID